MFMLVPLLTKLTRQSPLLSVLSVKSVVFPMQVRTSGLGSETSRLPLVSVASACQTSLDIPLGMLLIQNERTAMLALRCFL